MTPLSATDWLSGLLPSLIMFILWLVPVLIAFANLRKQEFKETAKAVWVLIILILPVVGPITYLMLKDRPYTAKP